jgi:hypothetical protein
MRVRIVRGFYWKAQDRVMKPGDVANVPDEDAQLWLRHEMAMQDKTIDVPENKATEAVNSNPPPLEPKPLAPDVITRGKPRKVKKAKK